MSVGERRIKIALTLLVRDEADIIAENIAFHRAMGIDVIIVTDNASTDGTLEILTRFAERREITLLREPSDAYRQDEWATRMATIARDEFGADWVLSGDADEFWYNPDSTIADALEGRSEDMLRCERHNMIASREALEGNHWSKALCYRVRAPQPFPSEWDRLNDPLSAPYFYFYLTFKNAFRTNRLTWIERGAHSARYDLTPTIGACAILVYHFPVRSKSEFARSVERIGTAVRAATDLPIGISWKYRRWLAMTEKTGNIESAFAETLPDGKKLAEDIATGHLIQDHAIRHALVRYCVLSEADIETASERKKSRLFSSDITPIALVRAAWRILARSRQTGSRGRQNDRSR